MRIFNNLIRPEYSQIVVSARRGEEDFLFVIDFFDVESSRKNCTEKDYEYWHPVDPVGDECILGKKIQYIRHKEGAECSSQYVAGPVVIDSACPCTAQDYEWCAHNPSARDFDC
jgi:hypothetical protein